MQREVIKPKIDVPVIVCLDQGPEGQQKQGQYGIDYQYTVNHDTGVMWLPRSGRDAILKSGAQAGDTVEIIKVKRGANTHFVATLVGDRHETQPAAARREATQPNIPARAYYKPATGAAAPELTNGNGQIPFVGATPLRPSVPLSPVAQQLAGTLCAALDAAAEAEAYARQKGLSIQFTADDIRAIGLSIYIGVTRQQGVR